MPGTAPPIGATPAFSVAQGAPSVANVSPTSGPVGTVITISGANFGASQGNGYVTVGPVLTAVTSWSNTQIVATVPNISNGSENVQVEVGGTGGTLSNAAAFTVTIPQPAISSLSPTSGLHASMAMKEKALAKATVSKTRNDRYRPTDPLLAFLKSL